MAQNSLNTITTSLVAPIVDYLTPIDLLTLWFCGNKRLQHLLRATVRIWEDEAAGAHLKWPKLLGEFAQLRTVSISVGISGELSVTTEDLLRLPSSLETLNIHAPESLEWVRHVDLAKKFPNLRSLKFDAGAGLSSSQLNEGFVSLPPYLHTLKVLKRNISAILESTLPSMLTHLSISGHDMVDRDMELLPRTLLHLDIISPIHITNACAAFLPPKLTHLRFSPVKMNSNFFPCLPSSLLTFKWSSGMLMQNIAHLPAGLKDFVVGNLDVPRGILSALPPGLRKFFCSWSKLIRHSDIPRIPKSVERLKLSMTIITHPRILNDHFTHLIDIAGIRIPIDADLSSLPPSLTRLVIQFIPKLSVFAKVFNFASINHFWRLEKLFHLELSQIGSIDGIEAGKDAPESFLKLPPNLHTLIIEQRVHSTCVRVGPLWPTIKVLHAPELSNLDISGNVSLLPPNLETLCLPADLALSDEDVAHLPRTITNLTLLSNSKLTNHCVPNLPPRLRELHVSCNRHFSDACLAQLPRTLHILTFYQAQITPNALDRLPRRLGTLRTSASMRHHFYETRQRQKLAQIETQSNKALPSK